jgi:hypothetical protein
MTGGGDVAAADDDDDDDYTMIMTAKMTERLACGRLTWPVVSNKLSTASWVVSPTVTVAVHTEKQKK